MDQSNALKVWGAALKAARKAKGLSQLDVCRETGAAPAAVYRWEAGRVRPQQRFLRKLAKLLPTLPQLPADAASEEPGDGDRASTPSSG